MLCSVIIACYNAEEYIGHAIKSVLEQSIKDLEIIVCDDASTDNTALRLEQIRHKNPQVKLLRNPTNKGPSYSRNLAIANSCGEWLAILDADDFYHPGRLEYLLKIGKQENADLIADNIFITANDITSSKVAFSTSSQNGFQIVSTKDFIRGDLPGWKRLKFGFLKPLIKKKFLTDNKLQYDEKIKIGEDFVLYIQCLIDGAKFIFCHEPYYYYRQSPQSLTRSGSTEGDDTLRQNNLNLIALAQRKKNTDVAKLLQYRQKLFDYYATYSKMIHSIKKGSLSLEIGRHGKNISFWAFAIRLFCCRLAHRLRIL
jgi:glycosyltransferase involved in cell wall biosynthesis